MKGKSSNRDQYKQDTRHLLNAFLAKHEAKPCPPADHQKADGQGEPVQLDDLSFCSDDKGGMALSVTRQRFFKSIDPLLTVDKIKPVQVLNYLRKQATERSGYAANKDRKNLLAAWNWGIKYLDLPSPNPCFTERFPETRQNRYIPPENDFWKVYEITEGQDRIMLLAYLHLAARRSELFRLRWEDVDFFNQRVRIGTRKRLGGSLEYDALPMTDELFNAMILHRQSAKSDWVFTAPDGKEPYKVRQKHMRQICNRAGVKAFAYHAIRHLTASILAQADVPMVTIQRILRHKNLTTTERYIRGLEPVRPALEILSKRNSRPTFTTMNQSLKTKGSEVV
ncbi:MAG: site-specific integrase [Proteobacteria bacterium]|nr:site-specific integrase [Pseudomonadota bacterium]MBU4582107.1 site-specific integrase [Pseudomonadota bacterium]MCG2742138.1 site-specific integrase [Syntrophaceae bacterium]